MSAPGAGWIRRLATAVMARRRDALAALGAAVAGSACQALVPLVEREIVDAVIVARRAPLWPWLLALVVLGLAIFGFAHVRRYRGGRVALGVQYDLRNAMHDHLLRLDLAALEAMPTGQLVARANSDANLVQGLLSFLPLMGGNVLLLVASLAVMLVLSPLLAVVSLVVAPSLLVLSYRMRGRVFPASWDAQQREGDVAQIVDEGVNGVRVVKAFGQEEREVDRVIAAAAGLYGSQMRAVRLQARYQPLLEAVPQLGQVALLALGGWLALRHAISLGTFLAFSTYLAQMMAPARQLAGVLTVGQQARAGVERIFQILDLEPAIADGPDAAPLEAGPGRLDFCDVTFGYGDGPAVLNGFDLHLAPGERVALVGASGSGKSTATLLVPRFIDPASGRVLLDGQDLRSVTLASLRREVATVFEESFLFSQSVRDNIAYGRPDATDAEIETAARAAHAHDFVVALPDGYDTVVGERGLTLSGGQRQRLALARALLQSPRVLVLDDATSAVDARVEEEIHAALRRLLEGRTTLLVAHRRSTLHLADRIAVLERGRVVALGTHDQLSETSPLYRALLAGLDEDTPGSPADRREVAASAPQTATASGAWARPATDGGHARPLTARPFGPPSLGAGLGGGGGHWRRSLAPTPELLARVDALEPVRDHPSVERDRETQRDAGFSLRRLIREFRRPLLGGLSLVVLDALAGIAGPVLVRTGIDRGVVAGSLASLLLVSGVALVIALGDLGVQIGETFVTGRVAQRVMLSLRIRIWAQLQRLSLDYYEREMAGRIMTRMTTDVDQFESLVENGLLAALVAFVTFVGVGAALLVINPALGALTMSVVVPLAAATIVFRRRSARLYDLARERIAVVNADFQESLAGVREAQAACHEHETIARFHRLGADYLETRVGAQRLVATYFPFVQLLSTLADAIVLGAGAAFVASGRLGAGTVIAYILYVDLFFSPIQQLSQVFDSWQQTRVSVRRIADLMALRPRVATPDGALAPGRLRGELHLDKVHFSYPARDSRREGTPAPAALAGVDLIVPAGETVALVGATGAGKSTVVKLLARFYDPDAGAVRVDGHDLRLLDPAGYRRQLGYVPQEAFLFSGTVRDNIAYGRPDATDAEVEAAARAVGAHEVIAALPGGYHHELGERGRSLSAGERQLIALARAQLVDPAVLLLDEATSNLDLLSEARVTAAMQQVALGRTTVIVAHRLQTARHADRIVVLEDGRIAETGHHDQLVDAGGRYAAMWDAFSMESGAPPRS